MYNNFIKFGGKEGCYKFAMYKTCHVSLSCFILIHWTIKWPVSRHTRCKAEEFKDPPPLFSNPSSVPECLSFHLKTFGWNCYKGKEEEQEIVLHILQNAPCLKTAKISVYSSGHRFGEKELLRIKELESVPKGSTSCQLVIRLTNSS